MKSIVALLLLNCAAAYAQLPSVPTNVTRVQTVGYWKHAGQSGTYRIITTTEGWEHVWSRVFVEWLPEPASRDAPSVPPQSVELQPPVAQGTAVIEATAQRKGVGVVEIKLVASSNQVTPTKSMSYRFLATAPGIVKPVGPAAK